jgi:hypothetical protein
MTEGRKDLTKEMTVGRKGKKVENDQMYEYTLLESLILSTM